MLGFYSIAIAKIRYGWGVILLEILKQGTAKARRELRVESLKAQVDSLKERVKIQKCEFKSTS